LGDPVAGEPEGVLGEPEGVAGEPEGVAGEPEGVAGEPEGVAGEPEGVLGEPEGVAGEPEGVAGEPEEVLGEPEGVLGEPEGVWEGPTPGVLKCVCLIPGMGAGCCTGTRGDGFCMEIFLAGFCIFGAEVVLRTVFDEFELLFESATINITPIIKIISMKIDIYKGFIYYILLK